MMNNERISVPIRMETYSQYRGVTLAMYCPSCECENTHHISTTVHSRIFEDEPSIATTVSAGGSIKIDHNVENPSSRRDAVVMHYECESGCMFDITFSQHKGTTFVWAEYVGQVDMDERYGQPEGEDWI